MNPWQRKEVIGDATLYLGDALAVLPELEQVEMIFTDPPYGHNNNDDRDLIHAREAALGLAPKHGSDQARPITNDGPEANELFKAILPELNRVLASKGCCCCCCCGGGGPDPQFARWSLWLDEVFDFKQMVIWDKGPMGMGWHYRRSYETVLVAEKRGGSRWFDETNKVENIIRPSSGIRKIIPNQDEHPTQKPPELAAFFMRLHTKKGETVLDPFMGSGSTAVGILPYERKFIGIEIEERWFDVACERIENAQRQSRMFA
jgi:DNA modification methylase